MFYYTYTKVIMILLKVLCVQFIIDSQINTYFWDIFFKRYQSNLFIMLSLPVEKNIRRLSWYPQTCITCFVKFERIGKIKLYKLLFTVRRKIWKKIYFTLVIFLWLSLLLSTFKYWSIYQHLVDWNSRSS